ncbi:3-hydroxybutyryl-CoA dehydrogenase [Pseudomonas violetae]|jgi:3-hydroxybutyryl-CoA dehydrogenase|uniref:L-gulonate 3-dehydrogenase n=1 Tax=Pseudomonas violetae TaxID=2915813 RepID=A0ABT0F492_9PSED|nr:3-hydroxybutyryl-CoA dehydrogenase [Pseudomonas violetae]MCK1792826.1 3-hydroxybutyryl-CoA dehydrogenase [Pseudomonas violetae]
MSVDLQGICIVGAGRMGEGIALAFMFAGLPVTLIDIKPRDAAAQARYFSEVEDHLRGELATLVRLGSLDAAQAEQAMSHVRLCNREGSGAYLQDAAVVFEAVPELLELKTLTFAWLSQACAAQTVIASTTSTFLVTQLAALVTHPQRFVNAHWLNPAFLMPLVEVSRSEATCPQVLQRLMVLLKRIGKVPVQCSPAAGYIVPRIQALAMNEAARMVEEGVASADDIDTAIRVGFGLRFSVLGMLEFIDWGGGDILFYASHYLAQAIDPRFLPPQVIADNMAQGRNGLREGHGFYDYQDVDLEAYKLQRLGEFTRKLELMGLSPVFNGGVTTS